MWVGNSISQYCWLQHVARVWPACYDVFATCKVFLVHIWKLSYFSCNICGCCTMLYSFGQDRVTMLHQGMCTSSICNTNISQHYRVAKRAQTCCQIMRWNIVIVWPRFAKAGPTWLQCFALKCCDLSAGDLRTFASILSTHPFCAYNIRDATKRRNKWK